MLAIFSPENFTLDRQTILILYADNNSFISLGFRLRTHLAFIQIYQQLSSLSQSCFEMMDGEIGAIFQSGTFDGLVYLDFDFVNSLSPVYAFDTFQLMIRQ